MVWEATWSFHRRSGGVWEATWRRGGRGGSVEGCIVVRPGGVGGYNSDEEGDVVVWEAARWCGRV